MQAIVSVIIPTYKRSDCLDRAINSVLTQTYRNIEVIVVDDNNSDSEYRSINEEKLKKYQNYDNFKYIKHDINKNGAAARNTGIKNAIGDFITFLDDDDYFSSTRVEKLVELLNNNIEYDAAYSSVSIEKNGEVISTINANKTGNFKYELLTQKSFFGTGSNMFFRKSVVDKIGFFDESFFRHQDIEYMIRLFEFSDIIALDEVLVTKCIDDTSNVPNYDKMLKIKKMFFKKFKKDIESYHMEKQNKIYFDNYLEILYLPVIDKEKYNYIISELKKYGNINWKIRLKYIYLKNREKKIVKLLNKIRKVL